MIDGVAFRLFGHGEAVLPVDLCGVMSQLCLDGFRVVEDHHPVAADDHQFLFLERIEPAHEDMGADPEGNLRFVMVTSGMRAWRKLLPTEST